MMPKRVNVEEIVEQTDLTGDQVKDVLCYLVDDGWLFSSHVEQDVWEREGGR